MSLPPAEQKVRKLARVSGNSVCANCGTHKKFGYSTVCIKFHTFVCNNCKSSHQAISHRCKSLTMSSWSDAEVAELERKGNDHARRTWLKNAPPVGTGGRPREGDHVDVFKRFVVDVYERKRYYGEDSGASAAPTPRATPRHQAVATAVPVSAPSTFAMAPPTRARAAPPKAMPPVRAPVPAPVVADLLGFSAPAPAQAAPAFQANFDALGSAPAAPVTSFQPNFASFESTPAPGPSTSGFSFISAPPAAAPAPVVASPAPANQFADFAGMATSTPTPTPAPIADQKKQPVMSNHSLSAKSSLISSLDANSGQQPGWGGMQQNSFGGMAQQQQQQPVMTQQQNMMMQQRMMQQQQMMMQQGMNPGMNPGMNNGMNTGMNMMGMNAGMNMGMNQMGMGMNNVGGMNPTMNQSNMGGMNPMMNQQQMMNFGGNGGSNNKNTANSMDSLSMNSMSMNAWTGGNKKY